MREIKHIGEDTWRIVLVKTIDNKEPVYYRLVNLKTYETTDIPAYRILDEVIKGNKVIENISCYHNQIRILNSDGYESLDELIAVDEFDKEVPNIMEWSLQNSSVYGNVMEHYSDENIQSPSNIKVSSSKKLKWKCEKGHVICCDFSVFVGTKCECPICKAEEEGKMLSFRSWAKLTNNLDILQEYDEAQNNVKYSSEIGWKQRTKVWFRRKDEEVSESLYNVTVKKIEPPYSEKNKKKKVNLNHK